MQEKQQRTKLPSAWKADQWICHHQGSHDGDSTSVRQSIDTVKSKRQYENLSLASEEYCPSRKSKIKRLTDTISQTSHTPILKIPQMSEKAMKRWSETRDAYLGHQHPYIQEHRRKSQAIKRSDKTIKNEEIVSIFSVDSNRFSVPELIPERKIPHVRHSETDLQPIKRLSFEKQKKTQIIRDHFDDKCIGTEICEPILLKPHIEQTDQAVQVDLAPPQFELHHEYDSSMVDGEKKQLIQSDRQNIEYRDQATETDFILNIEKEIEILRQSPEEGKQDSMSNGNTRKTAVSNMNNRIVPITDPTNDNDNATIISSTGSNTSIYEQLQRLRIRFARLSKERRLISCLLALYVIIMCALLIVIIILLWVFRGRSLIIYREVVVTNVNIIDGVAQYGESCDNDTDCKRPLICQKKKLSTSGVCRCPLKYDFIQDQCIGDLNALCTKDTDCQQYMLCSGMDDGTRRCHCQLLFNYDNERKRCRGDYHALCENNIDCQANLICNKTSTPSLCSCELHYRYYPSVRKCRGDPGAVCDQATAECADNAECRDGACDCAYQFVPNENKICVDPCPGLASSPARIRYPGNCRRFIDCQQRSKTECPERTIFNFRTQLCDYPKNVLDC